MFLAATTLLCLLAMTVFAATARLDRRYMLGLVVGVGGGVLLGRFGLQADPSGIAGVVICAVGVHLWTRFSALAPPVGLGVLAVGFHGLLLGQGLPAVAAIVTTLLALGALLWMAHRHPDLATPASHLEAMLLLLVLAVFVGAAPAVVSGWHAATALNVSATPNAAGADLLLIPICLAPLVLGALYSMWGRRRRC